MDKRRTILLCDVQQDTWTPLRTALRSLEYDVVYASDATFALALALKHQVSAVVLGPQLHAGGPLMALRRLRASVHTAVVPIVAVAAPGAQRQAMLAAGAEVCLMIPADAQEVIDALQGQLGVAKTIQKAPAETILDPVRLQALSDTGMLDSDAEEALDSVTQVASRLLRVPVALISLVDRDRQFFKSQIGLPSPWQEKRQTPLTHSFCQWVVAGHEELVVGDARTHPVLSQNKAVSDLGVVAYAGVPLQATNGQPLGAFCAIDGEPRRWTPEDSATLRDLAQVIDAYTALSMADRAAASGPLSYPALRATARASGQGFLGASRVLGRYGRIPDEDRRTLIGIIERNGQMLTAVSAEPVSAST